MFPVNLLEFLMGIIIVNNKISYGFSPSPLHRYSAICIMSAKQFFGSTISTQRSCWLFTPPTDLSPFPLSFRAIFLFKMKMCVRIMTDEIWIKNLIFIIMIYTIRCYQFKVHCRVHKFKLKFWQHNFTAVSLPYVVYIVDYNALAVAFSFALYFILFSLYTIYGPVNKKRNKKTIC